MNPQFIVLKYVILGGFQLWPLKSPNHCEYKCVEYYFGKSKSHPFTNILEDSKYLLLNLANINSNFQAITLVRHKSGPYKIYFTYIYIYMHLFAIA